jgi:hypothetical protein
MRLLLAVLLVVAPAAQAARPFVTDDARIVDKDGCQIESFVKRQRKFDETEFWFVPACNPWGAELTAGHIRVDSTPSGDTRTTILQGKMLLKPLATNGSGFALSLGVLAGSTSSPYFNAIGSFSLADDRVVLHANLGGLRDGTVNRSRGTWGVGAEVLLIAPRLYGILESYAVGGEKPTSHAGLRIWIVPNRVQVDTTVGLQQTAPERRFATVGLRILW